MTTKRFAGQYRRCNRREHQVKECKIPRRKPKQGGREPEEKRTTQSYNIGWITDLEGNTSESQVEESTEYLKAEPEGWDPAPDVYDDWKNTSELNVEFKPKKTEKEEISDEEL